MASRSRRRLECKVCQDRVMLMNEVSRWRGGVVVPKHEILRLPAQNDKQFESGASHDEVTPYQTRDTRWVIPHKTTA
jgi:hypothetical protein